MLKIYLNSIGVVASMFLAVTLVVFPLSQNDSNIFQLAGFAALTIYIPLLVVWVQTLVQQVKEAFDWTDFKDSH